VLCCWLPPMNSVSCQNLGATQRLGESSNALTSAWMPVLASMRSRAHIGGSLPGANPQSRVGSEIAHRKTNRRLAFGRGSCPRWQYATFIAALCHDLGKLFELDVRGKGETWCPLDEPYAQFGRRTKAPVARWRPEREHGAHAKLSSFLMHHILSRADIAYLGLPRFVHLASCLSDGHSGDSASPRSQTVSRADQASVEQAQPAIAAQPNNPVSLLLQALQELIANGALGVNIPGAQVYVDGDKAAVVVPVAVSQARDRLMAKQIKLPPNTNLYNMLRSARLVEVDQVGRSVRKITLQGSKGPISLSALILPAEKVVPKQILSTLPPTHFEIDTEPAPNSATEGSTEARGEQT